MKQPGRGRGAPGEPCVHTAMDLASFPQAFSAAPSLPPSHVLQRMDKALPYQAPSGEVTTEAPRDLSAGGGAVDENTCPPCGNRDKAPPCARPPRTNHDGEIPSLMMTLPQPLLGHRRSKFSNSYDPTRSEGTPVVPSQHVSLGSGDQPDQRCVCQCFCRSRSWLLTNSFMSGLCGHCP